MTDLKSFNQNLNEVILSFYLKYLLERIGTFQSQNHKQPSKNFQNQLEWSQ